MEGEDREKERRKRTLQSGSNRTDTTAHCQGPWSHINKRGSLWDDSGRKQECVIFCFPEVVRAMDEKRLVRASGEGDGINISVFFAAVQKEPSKKKEKEPQKKERKEQKKKGFKPPNSGSIDLNKVVFHGWETIHISRLKLISSAIQEPCRGEGGNMAPSREGENDLVGKVDNRVIQVDDFSDTIFLGQRFVREKKEKKNRAKEYVPKPVFKAQNIMNITFFSTSNCKFDFWDIIAADPFGRLGDRMLHPNTAKKKSTKTKMKKLGKRERT